jgi:ABC-type amino acid transport substrate-binding protein
MLDIKKLKIIKNMPGVLLIFVASFILFKGCSRNNVVLKEDQLAVGMMSGWPPYMVIDKNGDYVGFDVDVANELGRRLNKTVKIQDLGTLESLFMALNGKKIDLLFSGLDITKKRLDKMEMVQYTGEGINSFYLLFWNEIPLLPGTSKKIEIIEDLKKLEKNTIAVEPATPSEDFLKQSCFNGIEKKPISRVVDMVLEIKFGKSRAAILEPIAAFEVMKKNPEIKYVKAPLPEDFQIFGVGIGIKKENLKLKKQIEKVVQEMKNDGTMKKLEQRWNIPGEQ